MSMFHHTPTAAAPDAVTVSPSKIFTWGRVAFAVVGVLIAFATFVAGKVLGAESLEPRVTKLESQVEVMTDSMQVRGEVLYEIKGYVTAMAEQMGVKPRKESLHGP